MRSYARIGKKGLCREKLIKPRKNEDMQGYETIWKEKLKFLWYATAVHKKMGNCVQNRTFEHFVIKYLPMIYLFTFCT